MIAWSVNVVRILSLAIINSSNISGKIWWFDFIHEGAGSLIFSGVAVSIYGWLYLQRLEHQLLEIEGIKSNE
jgi:exosortase/archaeosortase family protein